MLVVSMPSSQWSFIPATSTNRMAKQEIPASSIREDSVQRRPILQRHQHFIAKILGTTILFFLTAVIYMSLGNPTCQDIPKMCKLNKTKCFPPAKQNRQHCHGFTGILVQRQVIRSTAKYVQPYSYSVDLPNLQFIIPVIALQHYKQEAHRPRHSGCEVCKLCSQKMIANVLSVYLKILHIYPLSTPRGRN